MPRNRPHYRNIFSILAASIFWICLWPQSSQAQSIEELRALSIEELSNIQISSVSKTTEPLSDAAAAVYVISHDDIIHSGASSIPEILRLAPNLEIAQLSPTSYAISARGFNVGDNASLSNKLLVLIDGRSVYTPLFGGVYWDMQQVLPEDIERVEVISGPGGTLYGANAVNGVINIITRNAAQTQGGSLTLSGGNLAKSASLQYGGSLAPDLSYRVSAEGAGYRGYQSSQGHDNNDGFSKPQTSFRIDWTPKGDSLSVEGDLFHAAENPNNSVGGRDFVVNWQHTLQNQGSLQIIAYYDKEMRYADNGGGGFSINTYNLDIQHNFDLNDWNRIVWGAGERVYRYEFENTALQLVPSSRTLNLANFFTQDTISLGKPVKLTLGTKLENEPYGGLAIMPSARLSWKAMESTLLWTAVSRSVRTPTPVDVNLREYLGPVDFLNGSVNFKPESVMSYEAGTRIQASRRLSLSVSTFEDNYDDLRSLDLSSGASPLPLVFGNRMRGTVYGVEIWGNYQVTQAWRLTAGFNIQHEHLEFLPGGTPLAGLGFTADDPNHQASLRSSLNLGSGVSFDTDLRYVGALPHPALPDYAELGLRLGWAVSPRLDVSLSGANLLHPQHREFIEPPESDEIPRSFVLETRWKF